PIAASSPPPSAAPGDDDEDVPSVGSPPPVAPGTGSAAETEGTEEPAAEAEAEAATPPEAPVAPLTREQQAALVPSYGELTDREASGAHRFLLPPYLHEWGNGHRTHVVFPFFFNSHDDTHHDHRLLVPPFYRVRSPGLDVDAFAPLYFSLRGHENGSRWNTTVLPPFWFHTSTGPSRGHAMSVGLAPLFSYNETFGPDGRLLREHLYLPGVFHQWWPNGQVTVAGPVVYFRNRSNTNWAVIPFVLHHDDPQSTWTLIPPLLTYHSLNHDTNRSFTLVGPFFAETGPNLSSYNLAPIFFHRHEGQNTRVTFVPLFHHESGPNRFALVTPLGGYYREGSESTVILPLYQNHRGRNLLDAVAPLFFYARTPSLGSHTLVVGPVVHSESNTGYAWGIFPLLGRFHEHGRYDTTATPLFVHSEVFPTRTSSTWVFPTFHAESTPTSAFFNVYPLVFTAHGPNWHHNVVAPFVWDIGNRDTGTQVTVVAPFFARVTDRRSMTQWVFPNQVYWESRGSGERSFGWDFFPFVQYGEPHRGDHYWSILEGLVGYRQQGSYRQMQLFFIPFGIGGHPPTSSASPEPSGSPSPSPGPQARGRGADVLIEM
ncbi:MAG: hypothetical protein WCJ30_20590, partial [Deltaproteobacteria bacterium]